MESLRDRVRASKFYRKSRQLQMAFALWFIVMIAASVVLVVFGFGFLTATRDIEFAFEHRVLSDPTRTLATYQEFFSDLLPQWPLVRSNYPPTSHLITTVVLTAIGIPALFYFLLKKTRGVRFEEKFAGSPELVEKLRKWAIERPLFERIFVVDTNQVSAIGGDLFIDIGCVSQLINDEKGKFARDTLLFTAVHEYVHRRSFDNLIYSVAVFVTILAMASAAAFFLTPAALLSVLGIPATAETLFGSTGVEVLAAVLGLLVVVLVGFSAVRGVRSYGALREALADGAATEVVGRASAPYFSVAPERGRRRGIFAGWARDPDAFDRQAQLDGQSPWTDAAIAGMATTWVILRSALMIAVPGWAFSPWIYLFDLASLATLAVVVALAPPDARRGASHGLLPTLLLFFIAAGMPMAAFVIDDMARSYLLNPLVSPAWLGAFAAVPVVIASLAAVRLMLRIVRRDYVTGLLSRKPDGSREWRRGLFAIGAIPAFAVPAAVAVFAAANAFGVLAHIVQSVTGLGAAYTVSWWDAPALLLALFVFLVVWNLVRQEAGKWLIAEAVLLILLFTLISYMVPIVGEAIASFQKDAGAGPAIVDRITARALHPKAEDVMRAVLVFIVCCAVLGPSYWARARLLSGRTFDE